MSAPPSVGGDEVVQRSLAAGDAGLGAEAVDDRASVRARERDLVRLVAAAGDDRVGRAVTAACDRVEVDVDESDVGPAEIADRGEVGAAERAQVDVLQIRRGPW